MAIDTEKMKALAAKLRSMPKAYDVELPTAVEAADAIDTLLDECALLRSRVNALSDLVDSLLAARRACASEFPPDAEGEPDEGRIHENIRKLKAALEAAAADKRDQFARLLTIIEKDSEWADARAVDWTRGVLMATLKVALAQRQGEGS